MIRTRLFNSKAWCASCEPHKCTSTQPVLEYPAIDGRRTMGGIDLHSWTGRPITCLIYIYRDCAGGNAPVNSNRSFLRCPDFVVTTEGNGLETRWISGLESISILNFKGIYTPRSHAAGMELFFGRRIAVCVPATAFELKGAR